MNNEFYRFEITASSTRPILNKVKVEMPILTDGQVLIRVFAASLNYRDKIVLDSNEGVKSGLVPLSDGAGQVMSINSKVTRWKEGDRVMPSFFEKWEQGSFRNIYLSSALGGGTTNGVLSEYIVVSENALVRIPEHLNYAEAATLPCAAVTAWHALFELGHLKSGETLLIQGTGGVAIIALQLAVAHGAKVIVISSSDTKCKRALELGAWKTINYRIQPDWNVAVLELTNGEGVDHVLELGGQDTYDRSISAVAAGGKIAQIGVLTGFGLKPDTLPLQFKNASINGICVGSIEHFTNLNAFLSLHQIKPIIDRVFDFNHTPNAYAYLESANHLGKIVIDVARH